MSASTVAFTGALVYRFQELLPLLEQHLSDQDGEVLPHLLMADVERWSTQAAVSGSSEQLRVVKRLISFLERAFSEGGDDVQELIAVSFLEHLPRPSEPGAEIRDQLGPNLKKQLEMIG
jgi:hypothetical protein